jgi:hypothetical protein
MHVDASSIALGIVLVQPKENHIDHLVYFSSRKLSNSEKNYTTTEHEGLAWSMPYKIQNYLLDTPFKFFTDHSTLKYLVNKPVLGGRICQWILLFQEFDFEVVIKPKNIMLGQTISHK